MQANTKAGVWRWRTFDGKSIQLPIKDAVEQAIVREREQGNRLKVCIGTDSQVTNGVTEFASVIVFLREQKGGFMFIHNETSRKNMSIRERLIIEVSKSVDVSYNLCDLLDKYDVELEVHADINTDPAFQSNQALSEAMGYIISMGFQFKAKPDAFASTSCANKMC